MRSLKRYIVKKLQELKEFMYFMIILSTFNILFPQDINGTAAMSDIILNKVHKNPSNYLP